MSRVIRNVGPHTQLGCLASWRNSRAIFWHFKVLNLDIQNKIYIIPRSVDDESEREQKRKKSKGNGRGMSGEAYTWINNNVDMSRRVEAKKKRETRTAKCTLCHAYPSYFEHMRKKEILKSNQKRIFLKPGRSLAWRWLVVVWWWIRRWKRKRRTKRERRWWIICWSLIFLKLAIKSLSCLLLLSRFYHLFFHSPLCSSNSSVTGGSAKMNSRTHVFACRYQQTLRSFHY